MLVLGGLKVMDGDFTVGMLVAYQTLLGSFTRPLASFVNFGASLQELQADMNRLDDVLRYPADAQYRDQTEAATGKAGAATGAGAAVGADGKPVGVPRSSGRPARASSCPGASSCAASPSATARSRSR